jgi:hypothetical protein
VTMIQNRILPQHNSQCTTDVDEGGTSTLSGNITDPGILDTFTLDVDWGDGSPVERFIYPTGTTTFSETHLYLYNWPGTYDVTVEVIDDDGGEDIDTCTVEVLPVPEIMIDILSEIVEAIDLPKGTENSQRTMWLLSMFLRRS